MLRIWGRPNSVNVQKVMWCVAELGIAHERLDAGLEHGKNHEPWFLAKNPNGTVPLLEDGEFSLWESNTIVRYLAAKHDFGGLYPERLEARADAERWMDWQLSMLASPVATVFQNLVRRPPAERDMLAVERGIRAANQAFERLDRHLAERSFVTGSRLTVGDIPVGAIAHRWLALEGIERPPLVNLGRWHARLAERGPYRAHVMLPLS
jgi:glutathione S-transferase